MTIRICECKKEHKWVDTPSMESHQKVWLHLGFDTKVCVEGVNKEFLEGIVCSPCFSLLLETERDVYRREIDRLKNQYKEVCKDVDRLSGILDKVIEVVRDEMEGEYPPWD